MLTLTDLFCGAGGSSSGAEMVPGVRVRHAVNHWDLAIEVHSTNMPHVDHDVADVTSTDPRRYPSTDIGWFSPECSTWSMARGEKADYAAQPGLFDDPLPPQAVQRSRVQMEDVPRFAAHHKYRAVIVENVPDILKWVEFDRWLSQMHTLGYRNRVVTLNSAFAHQLGPPAPQLRDRVYIVFWQRRYRAPDLDRWTRPLARCTTCEADVRALVAPKPGPRRPMRYGAQYTFRCPHTSCRNEVVQPWVLPAASAIDWSLPAQRIGDRDKPLRPATLKRIKAGLARYAQPITLEAAGHTFERRPGVRSWPVDRPLSTQHTTASKAVARPPWEGGGSDALVVALRRNVNAHPAGCSPLVTFTATGQHHALVMRNVTARGDQGQMSTPVDQPLRTVMAEAVPSLVRWDHHDSGDLRPLRQPLPTQSTVQGDASIGADVQVEDCTFRMLNVHEIRAGMAFAADYTLLGTKRERTRMLGNAVTPPAARDLVAAVTEAITGQEVPAR